MEAPRARAVFRRGPWPFAAEEFLGEVVLRGPLGLPLPGPKSPDDDVRTQLPASFMLEVDGRSVRVLDPDGTQLVESWERGVVDAWVHRMDEDEVVLELRWPGGARLGRIVGDQSPEAREVAELLASDARARRGVDPEADAALRRLTGEILTDELRRDRNSALAEQAGLLQRGERPQVVAGAARGLSDGILLLTDGALRWCSGGRRRPLMLPRHEIESAVLETSGGLTELVIRRVEGRTLRLGGLEPPDAGPVIVAALEATNTGKHSVDELLERTPGLSWGAGNQIERVKELMHEDERAHFVALAQRVLRVGLLVVTEERLLWASRKGEPLVVERAAIVHTASTPLRIGARLDLTLESGLNERFDGIEPRERAVEIAAALSSGAPDTG